MTGTMDLIMEIEYVRADGTTVKSIAFVNHRRIPAEWMVGDTPLAEIDGWIIYWGPPRHHVQ